MELAQAKADLLADFLEVAVHLILYARNVYPPTIFERKKKYDVPVRLSRHPELNKYISEVAQVRDVFVNVCLCALAFPLYSLSES